MEHMRVKDDGTNSFLAGFATSVVLGANGTLLLTKWWKEKSSFGQELEEAPWCTDFIKSSNGSDSDSFIQLYFVFHSSKLDLNRTLLPLKATNS